ncbi:MAG: MFS transporter [Proteobacteria bacterium]|nr:MFS transporter [Pseudomonadota bacterium]
MSLPARRTLFFYALPAVPLAAMALPFYVMVPTFYAETMGISAAGLGLVLLVIRLFDAVSDPLVGLLADRVSLKWGRRRSVFLAFAPAAGFAAFMLFWPPEGAGLAYLALWGLLLSFFYTGATLPYTAWGAELSGDYRGRTLVSAVREAATLIGTLVAIILPFALTIAGGSDARGLSALAVFLAVALPAMAALAVWQVPEPTDLTRQRVSLVQGLRLLAVNRYFLRLILAFLLNGLANAIPATLFFFFVSERLGVAELRGPFLLLYFVCGIVGVPLAVFTASRFGKHRSWCAAMLLACLIFMLAGFLREGDVVAFALICITTGLLLGFDVTLPPAIQADVIDLDTMTSGEQRTGLFFAIWGLATKLSLALATGLVFPLLALSGFVPAGAEPQPPQALAALSALYAWLPVLPKLIAIALMWRFPISGAEQQQMRVALESER